MKHDRTTIATLKVIKFIIEHHESDEPVFGTEIMESLGLPSGTVYPLLRRFEGYGWVKAEKETTPIQILGRPQRINYVVTPAGTSAMRQELEEAREAIGEE